MNALLFAALLVAQNAPDREIPVDRATTLRLTVTGTVHLMPVAGISSVTFHVIGSSAQTSIASTRAGSRLDVTFNGPTESTLPFVAKSGYEVQVSYPAAMKLDIRESSGGVTIDSIAAPAQVYSASGDITVGDARAALTAEADDGNITVTGSHQNLSLTVGNGSVNATLTPGWGGREVRLEATNGNLHLTLPQGFRGTYDVNTGGGNVKNPFRSVKGAPLVFILAEQGNITITPAAP